MSVLNPPLELLHRKSIVGEMFYQGIDSLLPYSTQRPATRLCHINSRF